MSVFTDYAARAGEIYQQQGQIRAQQAAQRGQGWSTVLQAAAHAVLPLLTRPTAEEQQAGELRALTTQNAMAEARAKADGIRKQADIDQIIASAGDLPTAVEQIITKYPIEGIKIRDLVFPTPPDRPMEEVTGPDGQSVLVPRRQSAGMSRFRPPVATPAPTAASIAWDAAARPPVGPLIDAYAGLGPDGTTAGAVVDPRREQAQRALAVMQGERGGGAPAPGSVEEFSAEKDPVKRAQMLKLRREWEAANDRPRVAPAEAMVSVTRTDPDTGELITELVPRRAGEISRRPPPPPTAGQEAAGGYAGRLAQAEPTLLDLEPKIIGMSWASFAAQEKLPSAFQSATVQSYAQAARNFINAVLRRESGAVISPSEFSEARKQYLPVPGDTPATLAQKTANRAYVFASLKRAAGRAYVPPSEPATLIEYDINGQPVQGGR